MSVFTISFIIIFLCIVVPSRQKIASLHSNSAVIVDLKTPLLFLLLGCLSAFRAADVGNDTQEYLNIFKDVSRDEIQNLPSYSTRFEIGYIWLNKLLSYVSMNGQIILITTSAFAYYWYYKFIKKYSPLVGVSILLFFFARFHDESMNIVRQTVATGFCLWAYIELRSKKNLVFFLLMLAAFYIHKSSIVFLLAWLIFRVPFRKKYIKYFFILWGVVLFIGKTLVDLIFSTGLVQTYFIDSAFLESGKSAPAIILTIDILILLFYLFAYKGDKVKEKEDISSDVMWMLMACVLFQTLALFFSLMVRVSWYFRLFELIAIPYALCRMKVGTRIISTIAIVILFMAYYGAVVYYRPNWNHVYPYSLCLF